SSSPGRRFRGSIDPAATGEIHGPSALAYHFAHSWLLLRFVPALLRRCPLGRRPVRLSRRGALLLSALSARAGRMAAGSVAALGAGGGFGHTAAGQSDRGG